MKRGRGTGPAGLRSPTGTSTTEGTRAAPGTDRGHIASRTGQDMWGTITRTRNMDRAPSTTQMALNMKVQDPLRQSCVRRQHLCPSGDFRDPEPQKQTPGCLLGSWVEDVRRGHGVYTYPNGDTYDGEWLHHVRHGPGTYHYSDTGAVYRGCWVNDQMESAGGYVYSNHRYEGNFVNNAPGGPGKYVFDTGCEQHGEYRQAEQGRAEEEVGALASPAALRWIPARVTGPTPRPPVFVGQLQRFTMFNGGFGKQQLDWLESVLSTADDKQERVTIVSHLPVHPWSTADICLAWNFDELLAIIRCHGSVVCFMAGHDHDGGYYQDEGTGVHHVTFPGVIETPPDSDAFGTVSVYKDQMVLKGYGRVTDRVLHFPSSSKRHAS